MSNEITQQGPQLTFQEYQSVYSEFTKRTERINKQYCKSFQLKKENIQQLKSLLDDMLRQYTVIGNNSNITVFQSDKTQKTYSSIENFLSVSTTTKETEQIEIEYDILINVPNINKKQNYKLSIIIVSDLIVFEKVKNSLPVEILNMIDKNNISIKIDYVDYTIAKTILNTIDDWIEDISDKENNLFSFLEKTKELFASTIKIFILIFSFIMVYNYIPIYVQEENTNMQVLLKFILISSLVIYISQRIAVFISIFIKHSLSHFQSISAIELTEQDKKAIVLYEKKKKRNIWYLITTIILTIIYGIISSYLATKYFI